MSLTLRDAQHLCWKTFRKLNKSNSDSENFKQIQELILKIQEIATKIKVKENSVSEDNFARLFSELIYYVFIISEYYNVNLEESFMQTIDEIILASVG